MIHLRVTAPVTLAPGLKLHKLAAELLDDRRHLLRDVGKNVHEIAKPVSFNAGDEIMVEGDILGPARNKLELVDPKAKTRVTLGEHYGRQDETPLKKLPNAAQLL